VSYRRFTAVDLVELRRPFERAGNAARLER